MSATAGTVLVDGLARHEIPTLDRGLQYGDGVFETVACREGRPCFLARHLERLHEGCSRLDIRFEQSDELSREIRVLAAQSDRSIVKAIVTRGDAAARGYAIRGDERARRVVTRFDWPETAPSAESDGVRVRIARLKLAENPALARIKHLNRLELVLASSEPHDPAIAEALLFSRSGVLVSGTMSNVFVVTARGLRTPRLDRCGVSGIMRGVVLEAARESGLDVAECYLSASDLAGAHEIFLTNVRIGIWPVREIEGRAIEIGPVTRALQALVRTRLRQGDADA